MIWVDLGGSRRQWCLCLSTKSFSRTMLFLFDIVLLVVHDLTSPCDRTTPIHATHVLCFNRLRFLSTREPLVVAWVVVRTVPCWCSSRAQGRPQSTGKKHPAAPCPQKLHSNIKGGSASHGSNLRKPLPIGNCFDDASCSSKTDPLNPLTCRPIFHQAA